MPNKATKLIKEAALDAFEKLGGVDYLVEQGRSNPVAFMGLLGRILPTQITGEGGGPVLIVTGVPRAED